MESEKDKKLKVSEEEELVQVPMKTLTKIQEDIARIERESAEKDGKIAGLEELIESIKGADTEGEKKLRTKKNFEPKFRLVRVRKFPIAGGPEMGYVVGWTSKGAYQEVDRSGISPVVVDFIDILFLGQEKTPEGKIKAEKVRLLDLMNKGEQVFCKIVEVKREERQVPTGEEIDVSIFDPQHGLISTGDKVDGHVTFSDITYKVQIPGVKEDVWIDAKYLN